MTKSGSIEKADGLGYETRKNTLDYPWRGNHPLSIFYWQGRELPYKDRSTRKSGCPGGADGQHCRQGAAYRRSLSARICTGSYSGGVKNGDRRTEHGERRSENGAERCPVAAPIESGESKPRHAERKTEHGERRSEHLSPRML